MQPQTALISPRWELVQPQKKHGKPARVIIVQEDITVTARRKTKYENPPLVAREYGRRIIDSLKRHPWKVEPTVFEEDHPAGKLSIKELHFMGKIHASKSEPYLHLTFRLYPEHKPHYYYWVGHWFDIMDGKVEVFEPLVKGEDPLGNNGPQRGFSRAKELRYLAGRPSMATQGAQAAAWRPKI